MERLNLRQQAWRINRFLRVQLIALIGWVGVQLFFSLSPLGRALPFALIMVVESIWWVIFLVIMFLLFKQEYDRFVQSALELEEANRRLRTMTNGVLTHLRDQHAKEEETSRKE